MTKGRREPDYYVNGVERADKVILAQAITLIESNGEKDKEIATRILEKLMPKTGKSIRIGITGIPGVGKSTFIESFGNHLISNHNRKIAVLAIDPSSKLSQGSIMGDKTRMEGLAANKNAFIRPSPTGSSLGGVAAKSREVMLLCEASGYDVLLIETVGVGQSETTVRDMVDFFLLLVITGSGDHLQGIKRGIMEMVDHIAVNKSDGQNVKLAKEVAKELKTALHVFPPKESGWVASVSQCSSIEQTGLEDIWRRILEYHTLVKESGYHEILRKNQNLKWLEEQINHHLYSHFITSPGNKEKLDHLKKQVESGTISPFIAGGKILNHFLK